MTDWGRKEEKGGVRRGRRWGNGEANRGRGKVDKKEGIENE